MKATGAIGVVLIVLGLAGLLWPMITYTKNEEIADIGPVEITAENQESIPVPPIAAGLAMAAGVVLVVTGRRR